MSRRITAGNDAPFRWVVKLQGKPFDLSGKDVKVYVINSRGEIPVARLTIEGHEVSGVFEGRYQTRLGEHSLVLHVNEGRPEMKTAAVANVFELVQWSADAGGSDEGDVIVAPVLIESELSIGGGSSYDDTELREAIEDLDHRLATHAEDIVNLQENKADKSELTELSDRIDNLPKGDEFDKEGNYPLLRVGTADTAIDLAGRGESVPASFGFRASGGKSIKDGRAYIKRIKGNSVVWNQLNESPDFSMLNSFSAVGGASHTSANGVLSVTLGASNHSGVVDASIYSKLQVNHTYLFITRAKANTTLNNVAIPYTSSYIISSKNTLTTSYQTFAKIFKVTANSTTSGPCRAGEVGTDFNAGDVIDVNMYCVIDLTKMFGSGNEPNTIEEFNARVATLGIDLNAYNEGEVIHCNTESIKSVGDNAWDEEWIAGRLSTNTGQPNLGNNGITSKNYIRVLPNETYYCGYNAAPIFAMFYDAEYALITGVNGSNNFVSIRNTQFTTPANSAYMKFYVADNNITTYNHDICIRLAHTGYKTDYEPYWADTLPLPIIRKYFPQGMKKAGSAHDEIRYNKTTKKWEKVVRIGEVDMGSLLWSIDGQGIFQSTSMLGVISPVLSGAYANVLTNEYVVDTATNTYDRINDKVIAVSSDGYLKVVDSTYTDASSFKAAMQGVILYYELAEPIVTELDAEDQNFRDYYQVADFGTEMSQSNVPSAPFSADIIYQFNAVDMIREHELEITQLQTMIATMQAQLASLASMANL